MNLWSRMNSKISALHMPVKANRKTSFTLFMTYNLERLSDRQRYVLSHFSEVSTTTEYDGSSRHSKGAHKFYAIKMN